MQEIHEFRIRGKYIPLFSHGGFGKKLGSVHPVIQVKVSPDEPLFNEICDIHRQLLTHNESLFSFWWVRRVYKERELRTAELFHLYVLRTLEPAGEECGTEYDDSRACPLCGAGAPQVSDLQLDLRKAPRTKQMVCTIANEWVVSEEFAGVLQSYGIKGIRLQPVKHRPNFEDSSINLAVLPSGRILLDRAARLGIEHGSLRFGLWVNEPEQRHLWENARQENILRKAAREQRRPSKVRTWFQVQVTSNRLHVLPPTQTGIDVCNRDPEGRCRCPRGDTIGHWFISEISVERADWDGGDVMLTHEFVGSRGGLIRPTPAILISPRMRNLLLEHKVKGIELEVAHFV